MKQNQLWLTGGLDNFHPSMICSHLQQQPHLGLQVQTTVTHLGYTVTPLAHFFSDVSPLSGWRPISDWYRNTILWWSELQGIQLLKLSCMFGVSQFFFLCFMLKIQYHALGLQKYTGSLLWTKNEQLWEVTLRTVKNYHVPNLHKGWWEMCVGLSNDMFKNMSLGMETGAESSGLSNGGDAAFAEWITHYSERPQALHLNTQTIFLFFSLSCWYESSSINPVQGEYEHSYQWKRNTQQEAAKLYLGRCQSHSWSAWDALLTMGCFTCEGDDGPAEGYCATSSLYKISTPKQH